MKKQALVGLSVGFFLGNMVVPLRADHLLAEVILGDGTFPALRIWQFVDRVLHPNLFISVTATPEGNSPAFFYSYVPPEVAVAHSPAGAAIRSEGAGDAVGMYLYAENEGKGVACGANTIAATCSGAPAVAIPVKRSRF